jgi:hypothetical protein
MMRLKHFAICFGGLFLLGSSAFVVANNAPGAAAVKKTSASAKSAEKGVEKVIAGPVALVNSEKKEIAIERNGKQYPILIDGSTQIMSGTNSIALETIKAGEFVSISYLRFSDGSRIALHIESKSSSAQANKKATAKAEVKAESKKEAAALKAETKKETADSKAEIKAETKKETADSKAEIKAETKKETVAAKTGIKAETKKETAASKAEIKAETKKETAAAKAEIKAETKKEAAAAPTAEPKKDAVTAPKAEVKAEPKKDSSVAQPVKKSN